METPKASGREMFWQPHVTAWRASGLSQKAYCRQEALRSSTFGYWVRKLCPDRAQRASTSRFVPVTPTAPARGLVLALPNGLEIRGVEAENLPLVKQLLEVL